jgi:hypothetical protein
MSGVLSPVAVLPKLAASVGASPANPAATASTTDVMMGLAIAITPLITGIVAVTITGLCTTQTANVNLNLGARFGTGAPPANGAAVTGTAFGTGAAGDLLVRQSGLAVPAGIPFAITGRLALAKGVAAWVDLALSTTAAADLAQVFNISAFLAEQIS